MPYDRVRVARLPCGWQRTPPSRRKHGEWLEDQCPLGLGDSAVKWGQGAGGHGKVLAELRADPAHDHFLCVHCRVSPAPPGLLESQAPWGCR